MKTILAATLLFGCGGGDDTTEPTGEEDTTGAEATGEETTRGVQSDATIAEAAMAPTVGNGVRGTVRFIQGDQGLSVIVDLRGLPPGSEHGFHVHETGDCSAPDASSAGSHYAPEGHAHALPTGDEPRHAGDMGNVRADEDGEVHQRLEVPTLSIEGEAPSVVGRAVIVHAQPDDGSQPTGIAGDRLACGVVQIGTGAATQHASR
jgi:Cu-Zn family superoxide dismutase